MAGFKTEHIIPSNGYTKTFGVYADGGYTKNYTIDWGDGTTPTTHTDDTAPSHVYATAGTYIIEITGQCPNLWNFSSDTTISRVVYWGDPANFSGFVDFPNFQRPSFGWNDNLKRVEDGSFYKHPSAPNITYLAYRFNRCRVLEYIGDGIFNNLTEVTNASYTFEYTYKLAYVPATLWTYCTKITTFENTFSGSGPFHIPVGFYDTNTLVTTFLRTHSSSRVQSIPDGLFDKNILATNFQETFSFCSRTALNPYMFYGPEGDERFTHTKATRFLNKTINFSGLFGSALPATISASYGGAGFYDYRGWFPGYGKNGYFGAGGNGYNDTSYNFAGQTLYNQNATANTGCGGGGFKNGGSGICLIRYFDGSAYQTVAFTASGTWTVPGGVTNIGLLLVAGGGGGGSGYAAGGGGGGLIYNENLDISSYGSSIAIVIGGGGAASSLTTANGSNGGNSSFGGLVAYGGGGGGSYEVNGPAGSGGCGGGCSVYSSSPNNAPGVGYPNQGSRGYKQANNNYGGGGGGAAFASVPQGEMPDLWNCNFGTGSATQKLITGYHYSPASLTNYLFIPTAWGGSPILSDFVIAEVDSDTFSVTTDMDTFTGNWYLKIVNENTGVTVYEDNDLYVEHTWTAGAKKNVFSVELWVEYQTGYYTRLIQRYHLPEAFETTKDIALTDYIENLQIGSDASKWVHGSCLVDGYWWGAPRIRMTATITDQEPFICKVNINDYSDFELIRIQTAPGYDLTTLMYFESMVRIGNYLFTQCTRYEYPTGSNPYPQGAYLVMINTTDNSYKVFRSQDASAIPLATDGTYLYYQHNQGSHKLDPQVFINAPNQYYIDNGVLYGTAVLATYLDNTQGGFIDFPRTGYTRFSKGDVHSAVVDANYLYLSYVTGPSSGYDPESLLGGVHELHVVNKNTMTAAGWCYIPKSTDDMTQTATHLFFGIEVQDAANTATYGYGWGAYAIKKSDVISINHSSGYLDVVKGLPYLHPTMDESPKYQSYASLIFGDYLLDFKTNKKIFILDITDVDNWSVNEAPGARLIGVFNLTVNNTALPGVVNEAAVDPSGKFHGFVWKNPSGAISWDLPEINPFAEPTVNTLAAEVDGLNVTLNGYVLNENGQPVTNRGFAYGTTDNPAEWLPGDVIDIGTEGLFEATEQFDPGTYYYRAYATNSEGTGYGTVESFEVLNPYTVPEVTTSPATVDVFDVTLAGVVTDDGGQSVISRGFEWGPTNDPETWVDFSTIDPLDPFESIETFGIGTWYYRAFATNSQGTGYGNIVQFIVENPYTIPTIETEIAVVSGLDVTLSGTVTNDGGQVLTEKGFEWGITNNPNDWADAIQVSGAFEDIITLDPGTYYYRAYGINPQGTGYGDVLSFIIENQFTVPTIQTDAPGINDLDVTFKGTVISNGGIDLTDAGFEWGITADPNDWSDTQSCGIDGAFEIVKNFTEYGKYYYRAYATNREGSGYGSVVEIIVEVQVPMHPIYLGSNRIIKIYLGNQEVAIN